MPVSSSLVIKNIRQVVTPARSAPAGVRGSDMGKLTILADAAIVVREGLIKWLGPTADLPVQPRGMPVLDGTGKTALPGLVDSHTHLVWAGSRANEFEDRLLGKSYQEIATAGGGINATVEVVRRASKKELKNLARRRLQRLLDFGVTTIEVKSGYGLSLADELKCLEVIGELNAEGPWDLVATFLGAHAVPAEFKGHREGYIELITKTMLPEISRQRLAEFCDIFCETGVFDLAESERVLARAKDLGFKLKVHADELTPLGGAALAVRMGAASADHLLCVSDAAIDRLANSQTIATLLPGTAFFLGLAYAPARRLIDKGAAVALASDCNPGTCPTPNLPLVGAMACTQMKMTPPEVVTALTINAAAAINRADRIGALEVDKQADIVLFDVPDYRHMFYEFGVNHVWRVIKRGRVVHAA